MQRIVRAQPSWRRGTRRILPVLAVALLALGPAHAKDKKKKHNDADVPAQASDAPAPPADPSTPPRQLDATKPADRPKQDSPAVGMREQPRAVQTISLDRAISQVERRYKARVVRADKIQRGGKLVYELRLLSEEGRVWTVRIDAETGNEV